MAVAVAGQEETKVGPCLNDGIVRFGCLVVSLEVLFLRQGLPVLGSNGIYLSSHQVQEAILTRNIETQIDGFRYLLNKVIRGREWAYFDQYHFRDDDDIINYAPINQL